MTAMHGSPAIPFSELFADTVRTHGWLWACHYYTTHGMPLWEFWWWFYRDPQLS